MSEPVPDRPTDGSADQSSRPAPPGYGVPAGPAPTVPTAGPPTGPTTQPDARPDGPPYYGRVQRFGAPTTPAPHPTGGARPPDVPRQPPAPWPPVGGPPAPAATYAPAPGPGWGPPGTSAWTPGPPAFAGLPQGPRRPDYAPWVRRVLALVVDHLPSYVASALLLASYVPLYTALFRGDFSVRPTWGLYTAGLLLSLAAFGFTVWNRWVLAGRTGQSVGKRLTHLWLVGEVDGRPVGVLTAFLRDLLHVLDSWSYVGYLWPLWDDQHQTLADKIAQTVVVTTAVAPLPKNPDG